MKKIGMAEHLKKKENKFIAALSDADKHTMLRVVKTEDGWLKETVTWVNNAEEYEVWLKQNVPEDKRDIYVLDDSEETADYLVDKYCLHKATHFFFDELGWEVSEEEKVRFNLDGTEYSTYFTHGLKTFEEGNEDPVLVGAVDVRTDCDEKIKKQMYRNAKYVLSGNDALKFIILIINDEPHYLVTKKGGTSKFIYPTPANYAELVEMVDFFNEKLSEIKQELKEKTAEAEEAIKAKNEAEARTFKPVPEQEYVHVSALSALAKQLNEMQQAITNGFAQEEKRFDKIDAELKHITEQIDDQIKSNKELVSELLERETNEDKIEEIISVYSDSVIKAINEKYGKFDDESGIKKFGVSDAQKDWARTEKELGEFFGDKWKDGSLQPETKRCLITARTMFDYLQENAEDADYSGVCILLIKALERELRRRFFHPLIDYIEGQDPNLSYYQYPEGLTENNQGQYRLKNDNEFTLGAIVLLLNNVNDTNKTSKRYGLLRDYCIQKLFVASDGAQDNCENRQLRTLSNNMFTSFMSNLYTKTNKLNIDYRIPSAHVSRLINMDDAEACYGLIVTSEAILKKLVEYCNTMDQ